MNSKSKMRTESNFAKELNKFRDQSLKETECYSKFCYGEWKKFKEKYL